VNYYFDCPVETLVIDDVHPFNGSIYGPPTVDSENMHVSGCAGGPITFNHVYDDNGQINSFGQYLSLRDLWPLQSNPHSTFSNGCFINYYASGGSGLPAGVDLRLLTQTGFFPPTTFVCLSDNPNKTTVSATGNGTTATLTPQPQAVSVVSVLPGGGNVRYRVAWWPAGHPIVRATFTGSIDASSVLTVPTGTSIAVGQPLSGASIPLGTYIASENGLSGLLWNLSPPLSMAVTSEPMTTSDTVTITGFGNAAYDTSHAPVLAVNPFYVTVANGTTAAPGTPGVVQPDQAWTSDNPEPAAGPSYYGYISVAGMGGYNTTHQVVAAVTPYTVQYANSTTTPGTGGTVQETWSGDWSGLPGLQPSYIPKSIETGGRLIVQPSTTSPLLQFYGGAPGACGGLEFDYQIGNVSPFETCYSNGGLTMGAASGSSTYCLGHETSPACLVDNGSGGLVVNQSGVSMWTFDPTGPFKPASDDAATSTLCQSTLRCHNAFSTNYSLGAHLWESTTAPTSTGLGTGATIGGNGTDLIIVTVGTSPSANWTLTLPTAATGWGCPMVRDLTTAANTGVQTVASLTSTTHPVITWSPTPAASDVVVVSCHGY